MIKACTTIFAALLLCLVSGPVFGINPVSNILRPKTVFVTSQNFNGNLGGLEGADQKCQDAADAAGLPGTFMAWLSTNSDSPGTRFATLSVGPYILTTGGTVAGNWGDLTDGSINVIIGFGDENGNPIAGPGTWSRTSISGAPTTFVADCLDWTSSDSQQEGRIGDASVTNNDWTDVDSSACNLSRHLYCFEQ